MKNLFDYLENIYNSSEKYKKDYDFEDFVKWFIVETFGCNRSIKEGFLYDDDGELVCTFMADVKLDFKNKTIEILAEDAEW